MELSIVFEDRDLLVCVKPRGLLSQADGREDAPALLRRQRALPFLQPAHRLDREAGGLLALCKSPAAAAALAASMQRGAWDKEYRAVLLGAPEQAAGELRDLLYHDPRKNRTYVVDRPRKGVREAVLRYETLAVREGRALLRVTLLTGRTHQIRAQFSSRGLPLAGDGRYGGGGGEMGLWCARLALPHPRTGEKLALSAPPPAEPPFDRFADLLDK